MTRQEAADNRRRVRMGREALASLPLYMEGGLSSILVKIEEALDKAGCPLISGWEGEPEGGLRAETVVPGVCALATVYRMPSGRYEVVAYLT